MKIISAVKLFIILLGLTCPSLAQINLPLLIEVSVKPCYSWYIDDNACTGLYEIIGT